MSKEQSGPEPSLLWRGGKFLFGGKKRAAFWAGFLLAPVAPEAIIVRGAAGTGLAALAKGKEVVDDSSKGGRRK